MELCFFFNRWDDPSLALLMPKKLFLPLRFLPSGFKEGSFPCARRYAADWNCGCCGSCEDDHGTALRGLGNGVCKIGAEYCCGWSRREGTDGLTIGWLCLCSAAYTFLNRSVSLSISACFRRDSLSSASIIFFIRIVSAWSARLRSRSSCSTCFCRRAVSMSISHCERGSFRGGRGSDFGTCRGSNWPGTADGGWKSFRLLVGAWLEVSAADAFQTAGMALSIELFFDEVSLSLLGVSPKLKTSFNCTL